MCGIFGLVRNTKATHPERATAAFIELGKLSVERGRDSSGFAVHNPGAMGLPTQVFKKTVAFHDFWDHDTHLLPLHQGRVALGHTRHATQGSATALDNASPLRVDRLTCTHNGDVSTKPVAGHPATLQPKRVGGTDTEWLFSALSRVSHDRRRIVDLLSKVPGRAALAWVDALYPDRVYLARAALSPLSIAYDSEGNLYWASNPDWFRQVDADFGGALGFTAPAMITEGRLLTIDTSTDRPEVAKYHSFKPVCRASDARLAEFVVWRGFKQDDERLDRAQSRHRVLPKVDKPKPKPVPHWSEGPYASGVAVRWDETSRIDAALAAEEPEPWDDDLIEDDLDFTAADEAVLIWAQDGSEKEANRIRDSITDLAEARSVMIDYNLDSAEEFRAFRDGVIAWAFGP